MIFRKRLTPGSRILRTRSATNAPAATRQLAAGPANEIQTLSRRGFRRLCGLTGTGLAQPNAGKPTSASMMGKRTVPTGSIWASGLSVTRPRLWAVGSPILYAAQPCEASCTVMANRSTNSWMAMEMALMENQGVFIAYQGGNVKIRRPRANGPGNSTRPGRLFKPFGRNPRRRPYNFTAARIRMALCLIENVSEESTDLWRLDRPSW